MSIEFDELVFRVDPSHTIVAADSVPSFTDLSSAIGTPLAAIFAKPDRDHITTQLHWATHHNEIARFCSDCSLPSGQRVTVRAVIVPLNAESGVSGLVIHCCPIQQDSHIEDHSNHASRMQTVGELAAGVAHDFNNLLTVITGYSELLVPTVSGDASARNALEGIRQAARQAAGVTRSLLMFSAKNSLRREQLDLRSLTRQTLTLLRRLMPVSIDVVFHDDDQSPVWILADAVQLQQVIMNLVINARDAMIHGGRLSVAVQERTSNSASSNGDFVEAGCYAELTIADNGPGIEPDILDRVFEPFVSTKLSGKGTGLGLAIVQGIVHQHNGNISVRSTAKDGTAFTITLPGVVPQYAHHSSEHSSGDYLVGDKCVLLAEDNWNVRSIIATALRQYGFTVIEVSDGQSLMTQIDEGTDRFDLLITDHELPGPTGVECLAYARASGLDVPAIVITGGDLDSDQIGLDGNAVVVHKPFGVGELRRLVVDLLHSATPAGSHT